MNPTEIKTADEVRATLARIRYQNRQEEPWSWNLREVFERSPHGEGYAPSGWLLQGEFLRPDTHTQVTDYGKSRWEYIAYGCHPDTVLKTAWVIIDLTERHEAMESFFVDGKRVFDPHISIRRLWDAEAAAQEDREVG